MPGAVCTVELTEPVKDNDRRNLGERANGKPSGKGIIAFWAEAFCKEFGSAGRLHWGQIQGATGRLELEAAYPADELERWSDGFRTLNPFGLFDTAFAVRLGFVERRDARREAPPIRYRGLGRPLIDPVAPMEIAPAE